MKRAGGIAGVAVLLAGAFFVGLLFMRSQAPESATVHVPRATQPASPTEEEPAVIDEVRQELAASYFRPVSPDVLDQATVDDILERLDDPNTDYLTPPEYQSLRNRTAKSYLGVGLTVEPARVGLRVTSALKGPARQAGIRPGDVIVRIDGRPAGSLSFAQSLALMKGEQGTFVRLTIKRLKTVKHFTVMRQEIAVPSLRTRLFTFRGTKLAHARLLGFREDTARRLREATERLVERGARGLVLDLRDNPGGLLPQAVRTVSIFLDDGIVCTTAGLHQERVVYEVSGTASQPKLPLVVLVNGGSASAAEIVAAALQEHDRAAIVGRHTFGKASVQSIKPLWNGGALKLTTATYLTPLGVDLSERGVRPDVKALDRPLTRRDEALHAAARTLLSAPA